MKSTADAPLSREDFIQRHLSFNLLAFLTDAGGWWLGMSFFSSQTILPYFVKTLGGGDLLIGLIPALTGLGYLIPQLFIAPITEQRPIQRHVVLRLAMVERIAFGMLAPLTFFLAGPAPGLLLALFFLCITVNAFTMGMTMPGYSTMVTKTVPADKRGRLWGISGAIGGLLALGGAALSAQLLERHGMPLGFTLCFLIGFVVMVVSVIPLGMVKEPEALETVKHPGYRAYFSEAVETLRRFPGFRRLILAEWLLSMVWMAPAFFTAHALARFNASSAAIGTFTMTLTAASVVGGFGWGWLSDRYGNRLTLIASVAFALIAPLLAMGTPTLALYPAVFFLSALASSGFELGNFNIILEFAGEAKVATFQGLRAVTVALPRFVFPLLGGALAGGWGYEAVFGLSAAAAVGAMLLLRTVPDPRHKIVEHPVTPKPVPEPAGAEG